MDNVLLEGYQSPMRDVSNPRRTSSRRGRAWPLALVEALTLLLAVSGCEPDTSATILVELRTDLVPGVDFDYFEFASVRRLRRPVFPAEYGRSWLTPTFMGELAAEEGSREYIARLSLRTETVVERRLLVQISGRTGVQLILDRACVGVTCEDQVPGCLAGQCVAAGCITGAEPDCALTAECDDDRPCPAPSACATAACEPGGWCFTDATSCPPDEYCDPTGGCLPIPMSIMDGGVPPTPDPVPDLEIASTSTWVDLDIGIDGPCVHLAADEITAFRG